MEEKNQKTDELIKSYERATNDEKVSFAVETLPSLLKVIAETYDRSSSSTSEDEKAHPLKVYWDESRKIFPRVGGRPLHNGDILDLVLSAPEAFLPVWVEDLPKKLSFCILGQYQVCRIEVKQDCFLRWPRRCPETLERYVQVRMEELERSIEKGKLPRDLA